MSADFTIRHWPVLSLSTKTILQINVNIALLMYIPSVISFVSNIYLISYYFQLTAPLCNIAYTSVMYLVVQLKHVPTGSLGLQQFSAAIYGWDRQVTCDRHLSINSASDCKRHSSEGKLTDTNTLIQLVIIHIFFMYLKPNLQNQSPITHKYYMYIHVRCIC